MTIRTGLLFAAAFVALLPASANARTCDAIERAAGGFAVGKPFAGRVVSVVDERTIMIVALDAEDNRERCEIELAMYGPTREWRSQDAARSRRFLTNYLLQQEVTCMPHPSNRTIVNEKPAMTYRRGAGISASCDVSYPLDALRRLASGAGE